LKALTVGICAGAAVVNIRRLYTFKIIYVLLAVIIKQCFLIDNAVAVILSTV
jgi:hypothetical protein